MFVRRRCGRPDAARHSDPDYRFDFRHSTPGAVTPVRLGTGSQHSGARLVGRCLPRRGIVDRALERTIYGVERGFYRYRERAPVRGLWTVVERRTALRREAGAAVLDVRGRPDLVAGLPDPGVLGLD